MAKLQSIFNADSWVNFLSGLGKKQDKTNKGYFGGYTYLDDTMLTDLWIGEGFGNRIVSVVADDMTRNWFTVAGDDQGKIQSELDRLHFRTILNIATKWARLYRGNVTVLGIDDGRLLSEPVNLKAIKKIDWIRNYPACNVDISEINVNKDVNSPYFEDVEVYPISKIDGTVIQVHASRCLILKGEPVPPTNISTLDFRYRFWGMSCLQAPWERLSHFGQVEQGITNLMMELVIGKLKVKGLGEILSANNVQAVYNRLEVINASKSLINSMLLDSEEDFIRDSASIAGVADVLDRFMMMLSGVTGIPVTRLFGRSAAGMNSTGENDLTTYYDMVSSKQDVWLMPPTQTLVNMVNVYLKASSDPRITFNPVWEMTEKEKTDIRQTQSQTDERYINSGVLTPEEVRINRFEGESSLETSVEGEAPDVETAPV